MFRMDLTESVILARPQLGGKQFFYFEQIVTYFETMRFFNEYLHMTIILVDAMTTAF